MWNVLCPTAMIKISSISYSIANGVKLNNFFLIAFQLNHTVLALKVLKTRKQSVALKYEDMYKTMKVQCPV